MHVTVRRAARHVRSLAGALGVAVLVTLCATLLPATASAIPTGKIAGTVRSTSTHEGIEDAKVCASPSGGGAKTCAEAGPQGAYTIESLVEGEYTLEFTGEVCFGPFCEHEYTSKDSTDVEVKAGATTEDPATSAELTPLTGEISGRVTAGGAPLAGIDVCASGANFECEATNANGEYTLDDLKIGSYTVEFRAIIPRSCKGLTCAPANYVTQYWNDKPTSEAANQVTVEAGKTTTGIDAEMQVGGQIAGRVTSASIYAQPLAGVDVCATSAATDAEGLREGEGRCAFTNSSGEYTIPTLATRSYEVTFTGVACTESSSGKLKCTHPYLGLIYQGVVAVSAPATTAGIDGSLLEISPAKPANTGAPAVTGTAAVGKALSCSTGTWTNNPTSLAYKWLRKGVAIAGQTTSTYTVQSADVGAGVACEVTASNGAGATGTLSNTVTIPKPVPGVAAFQSAHVKGATVSVTLRCTGASACSGALKLAVRLGHGRHGKARTVTIGLASFSMAVGKRVTLRVHLTGEGRKLLAQAGKRGLAVQIAGRHVRGHTAVLRA
jgi:hypothetical protein